jgi:site-specific DNA-methyltransferase (adenine-specific)
MITLWHGDCLEKMKDIPDRSIDLVLTDPPYGTTQCKWDSIISFKDMWVELDRVCKPNSAVVLFGAEPFSSLLRASNIKFFKYDWVWKKDKATGHLNAKKQPMRQTEIISVFYKEQCRYYPQLTKKNPKDIRPATIKRKNTGVYGGMDKESVRDIPIDMGYPKNILEFNSCLENGDKGLHPTQKPIALLEYLIKTYTIEGETVLDFTMGSGSTGIACQNLNRKFIGIEKDDKYFRIAENRIYL